MSKRIFWIRKKFETVENTIAIQQKYIELIKLDFIPYDRWMANGEERYYKLCSYIWNSLKEL